MRQELEKLLIACGQSREKERGTLGERTADFEAALCGKDGPDGRDLRSSARAARSTSVEWQVHRWRRCAARSAGAWTFQEEPGGCPLWAEMTPPPT